MGECSSREYSLERENTTFLDLIISSSSHKISKYVFSSYFSSDSVERWLSFIVDTSLPQMEKLYYSLQSCKDTESIEKIMEEYFEMLDNMKIQRHLDESNYSPESVVFTTLNEIENYIVSIRKIIKDLQTSILSTKNQIAYLHQKKRWYHWWVSDDIIFRIEDYEHLLQFKIQKYEEFREKMNYKLKIHLEKIFDQENEKIALSFYYELIRKNRASFPMEGDETKEMYEDLLKMMRGMSSPFRNPLVNQKIVHLLKITREKLVKLKENPEISNYKKHLEKIKRKRLRSILDYGCEICGGDEFVSANEFYEKVGMLPHTIPLNESEISDHSSLTRIPIEDYCIFCHNSKFSLKKMFFDEWNCVLDVADILKNENEGKINVPTLILKEVVFEDTLRLFRKKF